MNNNKNEKTILPSPYLSLRYRFIFSVASMLLIIFVSIAFAVGYVQTQTIQRRIENQGLVIAQNLASVAVDHLVTYNYVALEKMANQTAKMPEVVRIIIHDKEKRVAGYSGRPDLQGRRLTDGFTPQVMGARAPMVLTKVGQKETEETMEAVVPVYLPNHNGQRWGIIRVEVSLALMRQQIQQTLLSILAIGFVALLIGIWMADLAARRVTRPLGALVEATISAARGDLDQELDIKTRDEVEILAQNFSTMVHEILAQKGQLEHQVLEISQLRQYAEKILATMSDGLLAVDMEGRVTTANPTARKILGLEADGEIIGCSMVDGALGCDGLVSHIQRLLFHPVQGDQHEIFLEREGERYHILVGAGVLSGSDGQPKEVIFNLNDITTLKKLEADIRQGQRLADLGVLAAGMAHEIRNPLSAIKTYVALLPQKIEKPGFLEKFQRTVPREINRLNTLIEELLELSRPPKYNFQSMDMGKLLRENAEFLEADFMARNIQCHWDIAPDMPPIQGDANQLEKVFINLLQNGAQAMGQEGGDLYLNASVSDNQISIEVRDTGKGIDRDHIENIFTPFFTTKAKGTGLGLAISHKVVSEHSGQIKVSSRKGEGTVFRVVFPVSGGVT